MPSDNVHSVDIRQGRVGVEGLKNWNPTHLMYHVYKRLLENHATRLSLEVLADPLHEFCLGVIIQNRCSCWWEVKLRERCQWWLSWMRKPSRERVVSGCETLKCENQGPRSDPTLTYPLWS